METTALNISEFNTDMREQMKNETSRTVKIFMLTYRCIIMLFAITALTTGQFIFVFIKNLIEDKEKN